MRDNGKTDRRTERKEKLTETTENLHRLAVRQQAAAAAAAE